MRITSFRNRLTYTKIHTADETSKKDIGYVAFENIYITGRNSFYPNALLYNNVIVISPYDEKIMSLNKDSFYDGNIFEIDHINIYKQVTTRIENPVFFFIYNFDNYYHFLYDTLPYLYTFLYLKKTIPKLKLLVNYPNKDKTEFYKFNLEFLEKLVSLDDLIIHCATNLYSKIYVSSSLTHGGFSNDPPRAEIHEIYDRIKQKVIIPPFLSLPKRIYISRRTWINQDSSNIGTDYTSRRKMMNEDTLVDVLREKHGFHEIFAENLTTDEKIALFMNAEIVCGSIGGGMANLLFSPVTTQSIVIVTPYFLDINYRFKYSMEHTNIEYFNNVSTHLETGSRIPLYCRVKAKDDRIGEICDYRPENQYLIRISNNDVAGFNNTMKFQEIWLDSNAFELLDNGLNSPYVVDTNTFIAYLR